MKLSRARVLGAISIGSRCQIGPNCVIFRDLPDGSTVLPPEPVVLEGLSFSLRFDDKVPGQELQEEAGATHD